MTSRASAEDCSSAGIASHAQAAAARISPSAPALGERIIQLGLRAYYRAGCLGQTQSTVLSIIDYALPSSARRLWVFDVARAALLFNERVAHGRGSGDAVPSRFSDRPDSLATSLGVFRTGSAYVGKHGYSLLLDGLEPGSNGNARNRAIVMHPADYMTERFVAENGRAGRSWGCPAVDPKVSRPLIDAIKDGTILWAYYPSSKWLRRSKYVAGG